METFLGRIHLVSVPIWVFKGCKSKWPAMDDAAFSTHPSQLRVCGAYTRRRRRGREQPDVAGSISSARGPRSNQK